MSRYKIMALMVIFTFVIGLTLVGDALAGEKGKTRVSFHSTKWQQIEVGDVEGHVLAVNEAVGIITVLEGDKSTDGAAVRLVSLYDFNTKTGTGTVRGYNEHTSQDGAKGYEEWEGQFVPGARAEGRFAWLRATGKWAGMKVWGTWKSHGVGPGQWYSDSEWEMEK